MNQAVILAGGMGTRMQPFTKDNPKPMYIVNGKPFIDYIVSQVKSFGIEKVLLLLGYLPHKIQEYLGSGERYGLRIEYSISPVEYDTGERLIAAKDQIEDVFLLLYCDNYCPIFYNKLLSDFYNNEALIQISAYANRDKYTKDNLLIDENGCVVLYDKQRKQQGLSGVDIGYALTNKKTLDLFQEEAADVRSKNFEDVVYPALVKEKKLFATVTEHRYYSVGSWNRIQLTEAFFKGRKTVFLDRDGTINVRPPKACYVEKPEDFIWLPHAKQAIKLLKDGGYDVILVSNQPGIARGRFTERTLNEIHEKMQCELRAEIGYEFDAIYYCPHNWDEGCECRKPKPGMLYQAQKDFSLNLMACVMVGDDERDIQAGEAAGCRCIQVHESYDLLHAVSDLMSHKF